MDELSIVLQWIGIFAALSSSLGVVAGFFGPIVLTPEAYLGPSLGILVTVPWGAILGGALGAFAGYSKAGKG